MSQKLPEARAEKLEDARACMGMCLLFADSDKQARGIKGPDVTAAGFAIGNELRHRKSSSRGIENSPAGMAGSDIRCFKARHAAHDRSPVHRHRQVATLLFRHVGIGGHGRGLQVCGCADTFLRTTLELATDSACCEAQAIAHISSHLHLPRSLANFHGVVWKACVYVISKRAEHVSDAGTPFPDSHPMLSPFPTCNVNLAVRSRIDLWVTCAGSQDNQGNQGTSQILVFEAVRTRSHLSLGRRQLRSALGRFGVSPRVSDISAPAW